MGFFDLSDHHASPDAKRDPLVEIDANVALEEFRTTPERVGRKPDAERKSRAGRKPMDAVVMFKTMVLGALYNLYDDQIASQVRDRLSFIRFLRLGLADRVPDAKTVWLWRVGAISRGVGRFWMPPSCRCRALTTHKTKTRRSRMGNPTPATRTT